ncbi:cation-translocating P-type ATPase [Ramlibacter sp. WS9]|uniref:cation-translocating P-type ATPase n=1 Tax=Ramlibacter sp. WS9 TaxID=1882741 RepID=UPI00114366B2|nr:cation-translocating P-type ATPase [Ramlibacter sp. WS9]ROZ75409.1 cation-translocating P-type ATPase [Ramlibacter sp. WS9]
MLDRGLTHAEAMRRLAQEGANELPGSEPKSFLRIGVDVVVEPMFLMLLAAGFTYLALGDAAEATFLLVSVFAVIGLALAQERKTQRALEALRDLSAPRALVVRDGVETRVAGRDIVRGDLIVLREGDRVAADGVLLEGQLSADESLLTGESAAQDKVPGAEGLPMGSPGADGTACVFAGSVITRGVGWARVQATGVRTAVGRIGIALATTRIVRSELQRTSRRVVRLFAGIGLGLAALLALLAWQWQGRAPLESLLQGIAMAMAVLPEEIPVVLTVFLALGAWRLSQRRVLARRVETVEALGAITVLAVDKTGTLTQNRMQVARLWAGGVSFQPSESADLPDAFLELAEHALLATPAKPFDPMEKAITAFAQQYLRGTAGAQGDRELLQHYPLTRETLAVTQVFASGSSGPHLVATKGAPEAVADLCRFGTAERDALRSEVEALAADGLRVLAVARAEWAGPQCPESPREFAFRFLGLIAFADPPRADVPAAMAACRRAGIRVIMMTGDHPATARAIARQVGLADTQTVLTGAQIDAMSDAELQAGLAACDICARLAPEQKLRLVKALQAAGHTVGMTGDGVNDAPALKAADVGIAMGERGTDVAREAAAIVLLDDSFASITAAIRQGRHMDDNIRLAIRFIFAVHVPVIGLAMVPVLMHWPVMLLPAQIVLLELVIDPACSVLFEAEPPAANLMDRQPRTAGQSPFAPANMAYGMLQGAGVAAILLAGCWLMLAQSWAAPAVRTIAFITLVGGALLLASMHPRLAWRAHLRSNRWFPRLALAVASVMALLLGLPWLRDVLGFALPAWPQAAMGLAMLAAVGLWLVSLRVAAGRAAGEQRPVA